MGIITNLKLAEFEKVLGNIPTGSIANTIKVFCAKQFPGKQAEAVDAVRTFLETLIKNLKGE